MWNCPLYVVNVFCCHWLMRNAALTYKKSEQNKTEFQAEIEKKVGRIKEMPCNFEGERCLPVDHNLVMIHRLTEMG